MKHTTKTSEAYIPRTSHPWFGPKQETKNKSMIVKSYAFLTSTALIFIYTINYMLYYTILYHSHDIIYTLPCIVCLRIKIRESISQSISQPSSQWVNQLAKHPSTINKSSLKTNNNSQSCNQSVSAHNLCHRVVLPRPARIPVQCRLAATLPWPCSTKHLWTLRSWLWLRYRFVSGLITHVPI